MRIFQILLALVLVFECACTISKNQSGDIQEIKQELAKQSAAIEALKTQVEKGNLSREQVVGLFKLPEAMQKLENANQALFQRLEALEKSTSAPLLPKSTRDHK